jgi:hypothetical protein
MFDVHVTVLGCVSGITDPEASVTLPCELHLPSGSPNSVKRNKPAKVSPFCVTVKLSPQLEKECLPSVHVPVMLGATVTETAVADTGSALPSLTRSVTLKVPVAA